MLFSKIFKGELKQVILVREDLNMPKGKLAVQVAHASVDAVLKSGKKIVNLWKSQGMKKVCLKVDDLKALQEYMDKGKVQGITTSTITDAGKTVFSGPTITCGAIGPEFSEKIDLVTSELKTL